MPYSSDNPHKELILKYHKQYPDYSNSKLARIIVEEEDLDNNPDSFRKAVAAVRPLKEEPTITNKVKYEESDNKASLDGTISSTETDRVKILDDFLTLCKVDYSVWSVDRYILNAWDVTMKVGSGDKAHGEAYTNYQIKVWLVKKSVVEKSFEQLIDKLMSRPTSFTTPEVTQVTTGLLYEICLFDTHFGKLAWEPETNENFDLSIAKKRWDTSIDEFFVYAKSLYPEQILFPVGNDFLHIDNTENTTTKGTPQDVDGRLPKIFDYGFEAIISAVEKLRMLAPVHMLWVLSNHDALISYFLCKAIQAYFKDDERVTVDVTPKSRKKYVWGEVLLGFEHGELKPDKLPLLMADEWKEDWSKTRFHEWHVGHLHKKNEMVFTSVDTHGSVVYRRIPSLTSTDAWHYKHGFINNTKSADAFVWHKKKGLVNNFHIYL